MNPRYSIIIPHYNIPELLMRCLRSIPVRPDVQVIVVDDRSPDADRYQTDYPELSRPYLEFYSTEQSGSAGRARNVGLQHARGQWLVFADADDFFVDDMLTLLDRYTDSEVDLLYFRMRSVLSDDITQPAQRSVWLDALWKDFAQNHDIRSLCGRCPVVWGKAFRRELAVRHNVHFDETRYSNDFWFSANMAVLAGDRVRIVPEVLYVATVRQGSLTEAMHTKPYELEQRAEVCFRVNAMLLAHGIKTLPFEPFNIYLRLLFRRRRKLYYHYFRRLHSIGYSRRMALRQMCYDRPRRHKVKAYLLSLLHL